MQSLIADQEKTNLLLSLHDEFINIQSALDMKEQKLNYRSHETTESELVDMRRLINKKCQQIFTEHPAMIEPAKIFSDMLEIAQKNKDAQVEIPKAKDYLLEMTPIPKGTATSIQYLSVSKSNISILGQKKMSDRLDLDP